MKRIVKILAIVVAILLVIAIAVPFFIDANTFRPKLESELTDALGRQVKVGNLALSLFSGSVKADDISIADDPAFSKNPFVQAKSLNVGVEIFPLIFSKALHVTELTLNQPEISLVKSDNGETWNFSSIGNKNSGNAPASSAKPAEPAQPQSTAPASSSGNPNLSVAKLSVNDGRLTISRAGSSEKPRVYDKVNIEVKNFAFSASSPFKMSADLPAGGNLKLDGTAGPIDAANAAATPLQAKVTVKQMNLAASGFIDPASGIAGVADFDGTVSSDGHEAKTAGTLKASKLQVSAKGSPAGRDVILTYAVSHNLVKETGAISQGDVAMGKAQAHITGTYNDHGKVTEVNLKLNAPGMPVDDLEAMLPALGVVLPPKSQLKGGTLSTSLTIVGPVDKLVITGPVKMENTDLAGFNLGSKLSSVSALSGKNTGNDTAIQNFSTDVRIAPEGTKADNINLNVPAIGTVTGNGTVSPSNELAFKMNANVAGLDVPVNVSGTTSDPKFAPDVKGLAGGLLKNALNGKGTQDPKNSLKGLSGMFNKKPK